LRRLWREEADSRRQIVIDAHGNDSLIGASGSRHFRSGSMLSKKSKIEQFAKSRENRFLAASAPASPGGTCTKLFGRFLMTRWGPSPWRASDGPAALENLVHLPENTFSTASVKGRHIEHVAAKAVPVRFESVGFPRAYG
jgi:hypothetical protein